MGTKSGTQDTPNKGMQKPQPKSANQKPTQKNKENEKDSSFVGGMDDDTRRPDMDIEEEEEDDDDEDINPGNV